MSNPTMADAPMGIDTGQDRSQPTKRRYQFYTDQHGRKWGAVIEKSSGYPCSLLEPQGWQPRFPVEAKYIAIDALENELFIDYKQWIKDSDEAGAAWIKLLREEATKLYGQGAVTQAISNPQPELLDRIGPKPADMRGKLEAALAGNRWVLGLSDAKPQWAMESFPDAPAHVEAVDGEIRGHYPDAEDETAKDETYPQWSGPKTGWKLSNGDCLDRLDGEEKEAYKARAVEAEAHT